MNGHRAIAQRLLAFSPDLDRIVGAGDETLLIKACKAGNDSIIALLVDNGADLDATNAHGQTAPILAVSTDRQSDNHKARIGARYPFDLTCRETVSITSSPLPRGGTTSRCFPTGIT